MPATAKASADLPALFMTDLSAQGTAYGDGARSLFATPLAHRGAQTRLWGSVLAT